jgi:hypothetical protein
MAGDQRHRMTFRVTRRSAAVRIGTHALWLIVCVLPWQLTALAQPATLPAEIAHLLGEIKRADTDLLAVSEEDGRFLRLMVSTMSGDAFLTLPQLAGPFDFVFLDAWKRDYKRFFDLLLPRLVTHGLLLAHNVVNKQTEMKDFLAAIQSNDAVMTTIVSPSGEGMSVSLKLSK